MLNEFQIPSFKYQVGNNLELETWNLELYSAEGAESSVNRDDSTCYKTGSIGAKELNQSV